MVDSKLLADIEVLEKLPTPGTFRALAKNIYINKMIQLLNIAKQTSKSEFSQFLKDLDLMNKVGKLDEYVDRLTNMLNEGTDLHSSLHYSQYDTMIDPETGNYKEEVAKLIPKPGKNTEY